MRRIMEACGHSSVGLTWNSNPTDLKNGSVAEFFQLLRPWIRSCHINELYKDAEGKYPYRELFRLFRTSGYDRVTLIEVGRSVADPASAEELLRYYKPCGRSCRRDSRAWSATPRRCLLAAERNPCKP
jgi:hypothetical protein